MEKKFKNGLVLGKFYPVTLGHCYLIDNALNECETVNIIICSLKSETINGLLRYNWLKELYINKPVNIFHCTDENPQYPNECESLDKFYNEYWVPSVYSRIKELDVVFTSEDYGDEFASYLGVKHVLVDQKREMYPVSGTGVRNNAFNFWTLIPDNVKKYFMKKIVIMGTESSGKSTLIKKLLTHYNLKDSVPEYGRIYTQSVPTKQMDITDFEKIAMGHVNLIKSIKDKTDGELLFIDTEAITTKLFGVMYLGECDSDIIENIIENQNFDLVLLLTPEVPWVNDGTRDFPNEKDRLKHFNMIKSELDNKNIKYVLIHGGNYDNRLKQAIEVVDQLIF